MCHAWWGTLGVYFHYHGDCEHLTWVLERSTDASPPVPVPPPFPTSQLPESLFWPRSIAMPCHIWGQDKPSFAQALQRNSAPEKHIVNVVKIIIKMMRRMTWASIHEWPKSNVKSGVLLFFLEGGGDLYNVDNGSTEKPSCQRTILHMLEACKDS